MKGEMTKRRHILFGMCDMKKVKLELYERPKTEQLNLVCPFCSYVIPRTMYNTLRYYGKRCGHCEAIILDKIAYRIKDKIVFPKSWKYSKDDSVVNKEANERIKKDIKKLYKEE